MALGYTVFSPNNAQKGTLNILWAWANFGYGAEVKSRLLPEANSVERVELVAKLRSKFLAVGASNWNVSCIAKNGSSTNEIIQFVADNSKLLWRAGLQGHKITEIASDAKSMTVLRKLFDNLDKFTDFTDFKNGAFAYIATDCKDVQILDLVIGNLPNLKAAKL